MSDPKLPEYVLRNRSKWDAWAPEWVASGERNWARAQPTWGMWGIPETDLRLLDDVAGKDTIELGCGTAYVSAWLARRGASIAAGGRGTQRCRNGQYGRRARRVPLSMVRPRTLCEPCTPPFG